jgi:hypothetical protein
MKKTNVVFVLALIGVAALSGAVAHFATQKYHPQAPKTALNAKFTSTDFTATSYTEIKDAKPIPEYLGKSMEWLVKAQLPSGGFGAGTHARQDIQDPQAVAADPATSAFVGMVFIRTGSTYQQGAFSPNLHKVTQYLLKATEETPQGSENITTLHGTQPQQKLGENIDVAMTCQFFSRALPLTEYDQALHQSLKTALAKCVYIIEHAQKRDGSWAAQGWAPVLNSAMACNALEYAQAAGVQVDTTKIAQAQRYQRSNVSEDGTVNTERAAGVALYSVSSSQRANTKLRRKAMDVMDKDAAPNMSKADVKKELQNKGVTESEATELSAAYDNYKMTSTQMNDDSVLSGFGNNGGEEFLSYMMSSESFITAKDAEQWNKWHDKMMNLFGKIQNDNGSWNGHHCITSPVFCTAAVVMTLTADRDPLLLASK